MQTWLITGCSSGLGRELAMAVLERGWNAVMTARDISKLQGLLDSYPATAIGISLDLSERADVESVIQKATACFGAVDVLVNNAGHGYRSAVEEGNEAEVEELFATNFFGPVALIKAVLPGMRERRSGAIVNVSSIAGRRASVGSGYYAASKFALEGMSDALRKEAAPLGIKVIVVEPGALRTEFAGRSLLQSSSAIADYAETAGTRRKENDSSHGRQPGDPARGARMVIGCVEAPDSPFRLLLGSDAVDVARSELEEQKQELEAWAVRSAGSDFPT